MAVKRAHMVTRGYLEAWSNARRQVHVWDMEHKIDGVRALGDATVVGHAYRTLVVTHDLEGEYGKIENAAIPALRALATGGDPNRAGRAAIIAFLDMHVERGRYADQASVTLPAATGNMDGSIELVEMGLGDRLSLAEGLDRQAPRLSGLQLERKRWHVIDLGTDQLITGDGAVLPFGERDQTRTVTFPLSPAKLLLIGDNVLGRNVPFNWLVAQRSRRWLVSHVDGHIARALRFRTS